MGFDHNRLLFGRVHPQLDSLFLSYLDLLFDTDSEGPFLFSTGHAGSQVNRETYKHKARCILCPTVV